MKLEAKRVWVCRRLDRGLQRVIVSNRPKKTCLPKHSPSARRLPARSCLRPAAAARTRSLSLSFSRCSAARKDCTASALAFLDRDAGLLSSSESSSRVPWRATVRKASETRRWRLVSCFILSLHRDQPLQLELLGKHLLFATVISPSLAIALAARRLRFPLALLNGSLYLFILFVVLATSNGASPLATSWVDATSGNLCALFPCPLVAFAADTTLASSGGDWEVEGVSLPVQSLLSCCALGAFVVSSHDVCDGGVANMTSACQSCSAKTCDHMST
jgi:hypothetical protein